MSDSSVSEPRSVDASLRQHHAASRLVSKNVMARLTRFPMRADADATERSGGIGRNDTSELCAQSTCMALVGDNTGDAFSALIAFLLMIAVVANILRVSAASVHWGMVLTGRRCIPWAAILGNRRAGGIHRRYRKAIPRYRATPSCYRHASQESGVMLT